MSLRVVAASVLALLALASPAAAATAKKPWPPREGPGHLFVHYGEEHWNDIDGEAVLTRVVEEVVRYRPDLVTMSGDKTDDGTPEHLEPWLRIMEPYDRAGVPYMAAVGNHDGQQPTPEQVTEACAGCTPVRDIRHYKQVFAGRPYPMGDASPYQRPGMAPATRPPDDPQGAATHYFVDVGNVRWIFIDNSCYGIINCDPFQNPPDGRGRTQYEYLRDHAREADGQGKLVFVVMHMPTRDPRDQSHSTTIHRNHVMGKGSSPDNQQFEVEAEALGVDGVFLAHIKGQWQYKGRGDVPYFIDGGAGGELYTAGPRGVDHGYWYGWRMIRVDGKEIRHDVIPVIVPGGIRLDGPEALPAGGAPVTWEAFARQPATKSSRAVVTALELRDPDPIPKGSGQVAVPPWLPWLVPLLVVPLLALLPGRGAPGPRRRRGGSRLRRLPVPLTATLAAVGGMTALAFAQRSEPTATPKEALPVPARIFTSGDGRVLSPVAHPKDDPRRKPRTQTAYGRFHPTCPGATTVSVTSGWEQTTRRVRVLSGAGPIVRSIRRGRGRTLARVTLAQRGVVTARLRRGRRTVRTLANACLPAGRHEIRLNGRRPRRATLHVAVRSDRKPVKRRFRLR